MENKANVLNVICLLVGVIFAFIGTKMTFDNLRWNQESTATIA
jgi:hypothetical protein